MRFNAIKMIIRNSRPNKTARPPWKCLLAFTDRRTALPLTLAVLFSASSGALIPTMAIILGKIFNDFGAYGQGVSGMQGFRERLAEHTSSLAGLGFCFWLLNGLSFAAWATFAQLQSQACRIRLLEALLERDLSWYDRRSGGIPTVLSRLQAHIKDLHLAIRHPLGDCVRHASSIFVSLILAFYYSWRIALVVLSTLPLCGVLLIWISSHLQQALASQQKELGLASRSVLSTVSNVALVKCCNAQETEIAQYEKMNKTIFQNHTKIARSHALEIGIVRFFTLTVFVQGFYYGFHLVAHGHAAIGSVITCFWNCLNAIQAFESVLRQMVLLERGRTAGYILSKNAPESQAACKVMGAKLASPAVCQGSLSMSNVTFRYPSAHDHFALRNVTFDVEMGELAFVVGKSGSGKSTLAHLLLRDYVADSGQVAVDHTPVQDLSKTWLRRNVAVVEQKSPIFQDTVYNNIALGHPRYATLKRQAVMEAAEFALLLQSIQSMEQGFDSPLGQGSNKLSGGQRQRLALARARLRDTPILILDEPTSALDQMSSSLIMAAVRTWRKGKTTLVITHDISQIESNDLVFVMEHGRIAQQGYLEQLKQDMLGPFRRLVLRSDYEAGKDLDADDSMSDEYGIESRRNVPSSIYSEPRTSLTDILDDYLYEDDQSVIPPSISAERGEFLMTINRVDHLSRDFCRVAGATAKEKLRAQTDGLMIEREEPQRQLLRYSRATTNILELAGLQAVQARLTILRGGDRSSRSLLPTSTATESSDTRSGRPLSTIAILLTVWPNLSPRFRSWLAISVCVTILHALAIPAFSYVFSQLVSVLLLPANASSQALRYSLSILAIAVVDSVSCYLMHSTSENTSQKWVHHLQHKAFCNITLQPMSFFATSNHSPNELAASLGHGAEETRHIVSRFATYILVAMIIVFAATITSLVVAWKLAFVAIAVGLLSLFASQALQIISAATEGPVTAAADSASAVMNEAITNIKSVQNLVLEAHFAAKHAKAARAASYAGIRRAIYCSIFAGLSEACTPWSAALVFWYGGKLVTSHTYPTQNILIVFAMLLFGMSHVSAIIAFIPQLTPCRSSATTLLHLADHTSVNSHETAGDEPAPQHITSLTCTNLSFCHPSHPQTPILRNLNLSFHPGQFTAIVGPSGSGKSTLAACLIRLHPTRGISLSNIPITSIRASALRSTIGYIPQTPSLFPTTVAGNITYGLPNPSLSTRETETYARAAGCHDFITSLPTGYATEIGEGGLGLSVGEAQRICIARGLARHPQILVCDECTSALDRHSAALIRQTLRAAANTGVMVLAITHCADMMREADRVVMLEDGAVVDDGSFEKLSRKRGGRFRRLLREGRVE